MACPITPFRDPKWYRGLKPEEFDDILWPRREPLPREVQDFLYPPEIMLKRAMVAVVVLGFGYAAAVAFVTFVVVTLLLR